MRKRFFSAGLLTALLLIGCSSKPVLKAKEIEGSVHKELDLSASCFFDSAGKSDKVTVKSGNLDIQKLGTYAITIAYEKETYDVQVKDSSGNVSDKSRLILQITSDGKIKENLKQERTSVSITVEENAAQSEEKNSKTASKKDTK